jgi:hypothetical protein
MTTSVVSPVGDGVDGFYLVFPGDISHLTLFDFFNGLPTGIYFASLLLFLFWLFPSPPFMLSFLPSSFPVGKKKTPPKYLTHENLHKCRK